MGVVWFFIVDRILLKRNNAFKKLFINFGIDNDMNSEEFNLNYLYDDEPKLYKNLMELSRKQEEISKIKNQLQDFRENIEQMDFIKDIKKEMQSKKEN